MNAGVVDRDQIVGVSNIFADIQYFERQIIFNRDSAETIRKLRERKDVMGIERLEFA
jgi:hypothetical protein